MKFALLTNLKEYISIIANVATTLVAIVAVTLSLNAENRNQERFEKQMLQSSIIAEANIKPLLSIKSSGFIGEKAFILSNDGLGTSLITNIYFQKNGVIKYNLADHFNFDVQIIWNNFYVFTESETYLKAGENITLLHLNDSNLENQGLNKSQIEKILAEFEKQKNGISIYIESKDLMGNDQELLNIVL